MAVALITGTSTGIGLATALHFGRQGHDVWAGVRNPAAATDLCAAIDTERLPVRLVALDVDDAGSVQRGVAEVLDNAGRVDVLVNNAGIGGGGPIEDVPVDWVKTLFETNYFGVLRVTQAVLPGMRERGSGRILTITSVGGAVGQPFADTYCGAKFAVEGFMQSLAPVAERFGIRVSVIEPAAVASDFVSNAERPDTDGPYGALLDAYLARTAGAFANAQTAKSAGAAIAAAVLSDEYRFRWQTSEGATAFVGTSLADTDGSRVLGFTRGWIAAGS